MSEDSHEIIHVDTVRAIASAVLAAAVKATPDEPTEELRVRLAAGPTAAEQAPVDEQLTDFDVLLDTYQDAQINGTMKDRADARRALRAAYRAAVTARPPAAEQAPVDAAG